MANKSSDKITLVVNNQTKTIRFKEALTTGSVYAVSVKDGADACGNSAILVIKIDNVVVGAANLVDGEGTLSLWTIEMRDVVKRFPLGVHMPAVAILRCLDGGAEQNVGIGLADVIHAGSEWFNTATLLEMSIKGDQGDKGDEGKSVYDVWLDAGHTGTMSDFLAWLKGESGAIRFAYCEADGTWHRVSLKVNALGQYVWTVDTQSVSFENENEIYVFREGNQTVNGIKTFNESPVVPTVENPSDSSGKAASTEFVQSVVNENIYNTEHTWGAIQTFSLPPVIPLAADDANDMQAATTSWVRKCWKSLWNAAVSAAQTISGAWEFVTSPIVPTPAIESNTNNPATTAWIRTWWDNTLAVLKRSANGWTGTNAFSGTTTVPTIADVTDASGNAASTEFVQNVIKTVRPGYPVVSKAFSDGIVTLDDRAINVLALGSIASGTINLPPVPENGTARDFWLVVTCSTIDAREIAIYGGTVYGENSSTFVLNEGTTYPNIIVFTEIDTTNAKFIASRRVHATQSNTLT